MVETLYADEQGLWLLDQRQLPHLVEYRCCRTAVEVATAIRDMVVRGAPAIGVAAAFALALEARECGLPGTGLRAHLEDTACMLAATRPTAVNLFWALQRMRGVWEGEGQGEDLRQRLWREAEAMKAEDIAANRSIGRHGAALLPAGSRVLTICNAGSLATCGYGTALGVVRWAWAEGRLQRVYACETRPVLQGARLTVWELQQDGIPVTLITDGAAGYLMQRGMVDAVVVGADRVAANGDTANKIGTYGLAVLAARHGVPFFVAAPWSTVDAATASGADIVIEQREPAEVRCVMGQLITTPGVEVWNPAFDVTPAELISAIITERGVARAPYRFSLGLATGGT